MEFLSWMFLDNVYLWSHFLLALIYSVILHCILSKNLQFIFRTTFIIALLWEGVEFLTSDIVAIYGSKLHWYADSLGDIFIALVAVCIPFVYEKFKG